MQKSRIDILNGGSGKQIGADKSEQKIIGRSHAKGGVDVKHASGEDYELEGGEVVDGDRVFSIKLKSQSGESFAAIAESLLKAKKKANDALKVASAQTKDKIRKKIKAIESELTALFEEQQSMNGNSTGEYAAVGTEMDAEVAMPEATTEEMVVTEEPLAQAETMIDSTVDVGPKSGVLRDPISDMYEIVKKSSTLKNSFKSYDDFKAQFDKDKNEVTKKVLSAFTLQPNEYTEVKKIVYDNFPEVSKQLGISKSAGSFVSGLTKQQDLGKTISDVTSKKPVQKTQEQIQKELQNKAFEDAAGFSRADASSTAAQKDAITEERAINTQKEIDSASKKIGTDYNSFIDSDDFVLKNAAIQNRKKDNDKYTDELFNQLLPIESDIEKQVRVTLEPDVNIAGVDISQTKAFANKVDQLIDENIKSGKFKNVTKDQIFEIRNQIIGNYNQKKLLNESFIDAEKALGERYLSINGKFYKDSDNYADINQVFEEALKPIKQENPAAYKEAMDALNAGQQVTFDEDNNIKITAPIERIDDKKIEADLKNSVKKISDLYRADAQAKIAATPFKMEYENAIKDLETRFQAEYNQKFGYYEQLVNSGQMDPEVANQDLQAIAEGYKVQGEELFNSFNEKQNQRSQEIIKEANTNAEKEVNKLLLDLKKKYPKQNTAEIEERLSSLVSQRYNRKAEFERDWRKTITDAEYFKKSGIDVAYTNLVRGTLQIADGIGGMSAYLGGTDFANAVNDLSRQFNAVEVPFDTGEFSFSQLANSDWWLNKAVPMVPFLGALMIPGLGAGRAAYMAMSRLGLSGLTLGAASGAVSATVMRPMEAFLEGGFAYMEAINKGFTSEEAAEKAANVMADNMYLLVNDFLQATMLFTPIGLSRGFSAAFQQGMFQTVTEGIEETFQEFTSKRQFNPGITFFDYATSNEGLEVFTLGAVGGLAFGAPSMMNDIINRPSAYDNFVRDGILKMLDKNVYPHLNAEEKISKRATDIIAQVQLMGTRKQISDEQAKKLIKDIELISANVKALPSNLTRNEKVAVVEGLVNVNNIKERIDSDPNMDPTIKEGWEAKLKQAKKYVQDMMDSKAQLYMAGPIVMTKEEFVSKLNDEKFVAGLSEGKVDTFVQNDPEVSNLMKQKVDEYKAKPKEAKVAAEGEVIIDRQSISDKTKSEVDRVVSLPMETEDGATFNVDGTQYTGGGLAVPAASMNTTTDKLTPELIAEFVENNKGRIVNPEDVKVGIYKFPDSNKVSIDLSVIVPEENRAVATEFAARAGQKSLFNFKTKQSEETGATGENPMNFSDAEMREITNSLKENKMPAAITGEVVAPVEAEAKAVAPKAAVAEEVAVEEFTPQSVTYDETNLDQLEQDAANAPDSINQKILTDAAGVIKALKSVAKGLKIILHSTEESYNTSMDENLVAEDAMRGRGTSGYFIDTEGVMHISLKNIQSNTIYHEGAHPVIEMMLDADPAVVNKMFKQIKSLSGNTQVKDVIDWAKQYKGKATVRKETIVEFVARVADGTIDITALDKGTFNKIKEIINEFLNMLLPGGFPRLTTPEQTLSVLSNIADALKTGKEIKAEEVTGKAEVKPREGREPGAMMQGVTIMKGKESLRKFGLKPGRNVTRKIGEALEARQREKYGMIDQKDNSPEAKKKISNWMVDEVKYFIDLMGDKSGKGWYGELYQKALDSMAKIFPEMATDQNARDLFTMLVAITSDGQKVMSNFKLASIAYDYYRKNGVLPSTLPGQRVASFESNLNKINDLLKEYDGDIAAIKEKLMEVKSIEEINIDRKKEGLPALSTNWPVTFKAPFAASVFGPKLGMFFANLSGNEAYPTLDRWWSRTFNRYRGILIPAVKSGVTTKGEAVGLTRFKELLGTPEMTDEEALLAAKSHRDSYEAKGYKNGTDIEKAANTIYKTAFENLNDAPFTKKDRQFMYETISDAVDKLNKQGYDLSIADVQAILWYFEKNLYKTLGVQAKIEGISYQDAANYTFEKWSQAGKEFDYNIKQSEEGQAVEDEDIEESLEEKPEPKQKVKKVEVEEIKEFIDKNDNPKPVKKVEGVFQMPKKGETLVPKKWKIDTDGKGNFLFYHYGNIKGNNIDPKYFGKNRYTSDQRQNSVSYFYTRSNEQESMVSGDVNVIKVPMEKVYPFNTDPLNFYDQAEANFRKDFPNGAFDAVKQIDYMNPLIQKAGFDMTVAQWETFPLRAETTKALPIDKELTKAYREFGGLELSDMREKYEMDILNKLSDVANTAGKNQEYVSDKYYAAGGSDANVSKLMKDHKLRKIIGKSLFDKWNSTLPLKSRGQFQGPSKKEGAVQETRTTDAFGNNVGTWKYPGGYLVQEMVALGEKIYAVFKNNEKIGTALTLAEASNKIKSKAQFQKRYGQTIERLSKEANITPFQLEVIDNSMELEYRPSRFEEANNLAEQLIGAAIGSNSLMDLLNDIKDLESTPDLSASAKIFILLKAIRHTDMLGLRAENERALSLLNTISKDAGETLRALQVSAIPESITYSFSNRTITARDKKLGKTAEVIDGIYEKIKTVLDDAINSTLSEDDIASLIEKAIKNGEVIPMSQADVDALNDEIAQLKSVLFATVSNLRAIEAKFPKIGPVPMSKVRNKTVSPAVAGKYAGMTVQQIIDQMALKVLQSGKISWPMFKDAMNTEIMKAAGVAYSDADIRTIYDQARKNQVIIDTLASKSKVPDNMLSKVLKDTQERIADYAKAHWSRKGFKILDLRAEIEEIFGNSPSARSIADKIVKSFEDKVKSKATDIIAKELGSTPMPSKKEIKEAKTVVDRMLEHIYAGENAGVLDTDMFRNLFAEKYNFISLNPEQLGVMRSLADAMAYFPPGSFERRKAMAMAERYVTRMQSGKEKYAASVFFTEMFYNNVLSGYSTILRASKGVLYTSIGELAIEVILQSITNPKTSYLFSKNGFMFGVGRFFNALKNQGWDQLKQYFRDGVPMTTKYEPVQIGELTKYYSTTNAARMVKEGGWKSGLLFGLTSPYWPVVVAARTVGAVDALIKAPLKEFFASTSAFNELLRQGMDPKEADFFKKMQEILQRDDLQLKQAEDQAREEYEIMMSRRDDLKKAGITISKNFINARKYEILDDARDSFIEQYSESMQVRARLMGKPMGTLGFGYDRIVGLQRDVPGVTYLMPFVRVPSNAMNEWASWSPYGIVRGVLGKGAITRARLGGVRSTDTKQEARFIEKQFGTSILQFEKSGPKVDVEIERYKGEARERGRDMLKGILGTSMWGLMLMYALGADDKEDYDNLAFRVTYEGPEGADYVTMNGLADANKWRRSSFRISIGGFDSGWVSYLDLPFAAAFAQIGYVMDNKYLSQKVEKDEATSEGIMRFASSVIPALTFVKSQSYLQGLLDFFSIFGEGKTGAEVSFKGTAAAAVKFTTNLSKSFLYPNLFRQSYVTYKSFAGVEEKFPERVEDDLSNVPTVFWENLLYNVPWAEDYITNQQYDRFGLPVSRSLSYNALQDAALDNVTWNYILPKTPMKIMKEWANSVSENKAWRLIFDNNVSLSRVKDQEELSFQENIEFKRRVGQEVYKAVLFHVDKGNSELGIPALRKIKDRAALKEILDQWFRMATDEVRQQMIGDPNGLIIRTGYESSNPVVRYYVNNMKEGSGVPIFIGTDIESINLDRSSKVKVNPSGVEYR